MLPGINGECEIRIGTRRTQPPPIQPDSDGGISQFPRRLFEHFVHKNQSLALFELRDSLTIDGLDIEIDALGAAGALSSSLGRRVLGECSSREKNQRENAFHVLPPSIVPTESEVRWQGPAIGSLR